MCIYTIHTLCLSKHPQRPPFTTSKSRKIWLSCRKPLSLTFHAYVWWKWHLCDKASNPGVFSFFVTQNQTQHLVHLHGIKKTPLKLKSSTSLKNSCMLEVRKSAPTREFLSQKLFFLWPMLGDCHSILAQPEKSAGKTPFLSRFLSLPPTKVRFIGEKSSKTSLQDSYNTPLEHTAGNPRTQLGKDSFYSLLGQVKGCVLKVCWNNLRVSFTIWPFSTEPSFIDLKLKLQS